MLLGPHVALVSFPSLLRSRLFSWETARFCGLSQVRAVSVVLGSRGGRVIHVAQAVLSGSLSHISVWSRC